MFNYSAATIERYSFTKRPAGGSLKLRRLFATAAFAVVAIVLLMRSHFNTNADLATLLVPTFIQGAALAVFFIPLATLGLSCLTATGAH